MEGISDIRISGMDEKRPPRIRKEPYIELFFKLSHQAPVEWCEDFNRLVSKWEYTVKIKPAAGLFIETWVRNPDEVEGSYAALKKAVISCNEDYIARIEAAASVAAGATDASQEEGEQGRLNRIIAGLDFDAPAVVAA
jgi:hypothetical protein